MRSSTAVAHIGQLATRPCLHTQHRDKATSGRQQYRLPFTEMCMRPFAVDDLRWRVRSPMALAEPLDDAGLVIGVLAGQRHAVAATSGGSLLPWRLTDDHAAPADGAVAIHPLDVLLQHSGRAHGFSLAPVRPGQERKNMAREICYYDSGRREVACNPMQCTSEAGVSADGRTVAECRRTSSNNRSAGPPQKTTDTKALKTNPAPYAQQIAGNVYRMTCAATPG